MHWYHSLYWRIALGFVVFLAAMLVVQAVLFVWVVGRSGRTLSGQSPARFAQTVAFDLANALSSEPDLDVARYVRDQYAQTTHPFFVMLTDGKMVTSGSGSFPESMIRAARARLQRRFDVPDGERFERAPWMGRGGRPDRVDREGQRPDRGGPRADRDGPRPDRERPRDGDFRFGPPPPGFGPPPPSFGRPTPIVVNGQLAGVVVVPPEAPFSVLLRRFAPMLGASAAGVLIVGVIAASAMIFGPARVRLRGLESAARRLGAGDLSARAPDRGGDEIAAVASAFNAMADDLGARAEALAASDRVRRQLLADVSHELTTPVTAMRGYIETLTMPELSLNEATRARYLAIVGDETARLERIIGDLLDLARLEGGGGTFTVDDVPVQQVFDRVAARHERACEAAAITMTRTIEPGAEFVRGDRDRLEQALQNLAANAMRYAPHGSAIRLVAKRTGEGVVLSVEDEGPGIAAEHLPHLFDRFYKTEPSRALDHVDVPDHRTSHGSGLGLSIVKAIVERHGGHISVESRPGRTVFQLTIGN